MREILHPPSVSFVTTANINNSNQHQSYYHYGDVAVADVLLFPCQQLKLMFTFESPQHFLFLF